MISIYRDFIDNKTSSDLIELYQSKLDDEFEITDNVYNFNGISIINNKPIFAKNWDLSVFRIQKVTKQIKVVKRYHTHKDGYSVVIFLNDNFTGGELIFPNVTIKPIKNSMVYFTGNEPHYVNEVTDFDRYTIVGFLKSPISNFNAKLI
jgi:predicted 2-oxoglutarate/Fe(II)-dependent dioxygenase YbiX